MKKLIIQFIKFGLVGGTCFLIDYVIGLALLNLILQISSEAFFEEASIISSIIGFTVSVIANYHLSFKYVFERKEKMNRKVEFIIFIVLSVIGLFINSFVIWVMVGPIYKTNTFLKDKLGYNIMYTIAKITATAIVMVYNFVTRKIFLEERNAKEK